MSRFNSSNNKQLNDKIEILSGETKNIYPTMTKSEIRGYINQFSNLKFKAGTYNIPLTDDGLGFSIPSNRTIIFEENAVLQALPTASGGYNLLLLDNVQNVRIEYPTLIGERTGHLGSVGESGMGINIKGGSKNIKIIKPICKDFWGDGIYINNVIDCIIEYPVLDNNRRNNMSVVCADNLRVVEPRFLNANGTNPQAGIDIEPNKNTEWLKNIKIIRPYFKGNAICGLQIYLNYSDSTSMPCDIEIINPTFDGDKIIVSGVETAKKGYIKIDKPRFKNIPVMAIDIRDKSIDSPLLEIVDPYIEDFNSANTSVNNNAIQMIVASTSTTVGSLGGIRIVRPVVKTSIITTLFAIRFEDQRVTPSLLSNIEVIDADVQGVSRTKVSIGKNDGTCLVTYSEKMAKINATLGSLMDFKNDAPYVRTTGANPNIFVDKDTLSNNENQEYTIDVRGSGATVKFQQNGGVAKPLKVLPLSATTVNALTTTTSGSRLKFKKIADDTIIITQMIGTWTTA